MLNMRESLMKWPWSLIFGTDFVIAPNISEKRDTKEQPFPCKHGGLFFVFVERNCHDTTNLEGRSTQEEKSSQTKENLKYDDFPGEKGLDRPGYVRVNVLSHFCT